MCAHTQSHLHFMHVHTHPQADTPMHTLIRTPILTYTHTSYMSTHVYTLPPYTRMHKCMIRPYTLPYLYLQTRMCTCTHTCGAHIRTRLHAFTHTRALSCIDTYTHTSTHSLCLLLPLLLQRQGHMTSSPAWHWPLDKEHFRARSPAVPGQSEVLPSSLSGRGARLRPGGPHR